MLPRRLTSSGLLLIFLAGMMCICGLVGYKHMPTSETVGAPEVYASGARSTPAYDPAEGHIPVGGLYTVAIFALSLGAALALLLGVARKWLSARAILFFGRSLPPVTLPRPRITARSQLQVFLL